MSDELHNFSQALEHLANGNPIDYHVEIGDHYGALMSRETWLELVARGSFIDYDGMGHELNGEGKIFAGRIRPTIGSGQHHARYKIYSLVQPLRPGSPPQLA